MIPSGYHPKEKRKKKEGRYFEKRSITFFFFGFRAPALCRPADEIASFV